METTLYNQFKHSLWERFNKSEDVKPINVKNISRTGQVVTMYLLNENTEVIIIISKLVRVKDFEGRGKLVRVARVNLPNNTTEYYRF